MCVFWRGGGIKELEIEKYVIMIDLKYIYFCLLNCVNFLLGK